MPAEGQKSRIFCFAGSRPTFVAPMAILFCLICFVHSLLRTMRDTLVVTAEGSGAEVIPFIQVWFLLPATLAVTWLFTCLLRRYSQRAVFVIIVSGFAGFFVLFGCVLYPLREVLALPVGKGTSLAYFGGMLAMLRHWVLSAFYVVSELWGCMVTSVLFWGLANEVSRLHEARQWYGFFSIGGNLGATLSGLVPVCTERFQTHTVSVQVALLFLGCLAIIGLYQWMCHRLFVEEHHDGLHEVRTEEKKSTAPRGKIRSLLSDRYLLCLAVMVCGYSLVLNFTELVWRGQLHLVYTEYNDYGRILGYTTTLEGLLSLGLSMSIPFFFTRFGWTMTALICPVLMLCSALVFFSLPMIPVDVLWLPTGIVLSGAAVTVFGRATKHSLFDAAKDMAYIPLDSGVKLRAKAMIDGAGFRLCRTGSSGVFQVFLLCFGTMAATTPLVGVLVIGALVFWTSATVSLGKQFEEQHASQQEKEETETLLASA